MSEDENISLTAHRGQGPSLCPAGAKAEWHWMLMATMSGDPSHRQGRRRAGRRAAVQAGGPLISPMLRKALPLLPDGDGKQRDRQAQGGSGGCDQRDFQGWENIFWGHAQAEAGCAALQTEGCTGRKAPRPPLVFSRTTEVCVRKAQGRQEEKPCSSPIATTQARDVCFPPPSMPYLGSGRKKQQVC